MNMKNYLVGSCIFVFAGLSLAQTSASPKPQMQYLGAFDAGQPGTSIFKMYDPSDDVLCYVLMPETAGRKQVDGKWVYDGNSVGSLSCIKANSVKNEVKMK